MALASALELPVYVLQLSSDHLTDESLSRLMQTVKAKTCILLFEDVDAASEVVKKRHDESTAAGGEADETTQDQMMKLMQQTQQTLLANANRETNRNHVTLSGLLNILDGPFATKGRMVFMTTNHKHVLDRAIIRPGRIDYELEFTHVTEEQVRRQFYRFYADLHGDNSQPLSMDHKTREKCADQFATRIAKSNVRFTTADIQGYLMKHRKMPARALDKLDAFLQSKRT